MNARIGIDVVSFGADGDSCELKSMQVSSHLMAPSSNLMGLLSPSNTSQQIVIPQDWRKWYVLKKPTAIAYVQDTVHVAIKPKIKAD